MNVLANHLWQSTFFATAVALAAILLRRNSARLRYWLWLAASVKFLIPFSTLVSLGGRLTKPRVMMPADTSALHALTVKQASTYFAPAPTFPFATSHLPTMFAAIWLAGSLLLLARWFHRWRRLHSAARSARPLPMHQTLPVLSSAAMIEPGIFGLFRPVLLLPEGIAEDLAPEQFEAILAHELCHARHRDNLTAAIHMCVETIFWFHPVVWWIGAKMIEERERDCDESALRRGSEPEEYAQTIVNVCKSYIESPIPCAAGITGANLKKRIREIMTWRGSLRVTWPRKLAIAAAGIAAVSIPLLIGIVRAQTLPPAPAYTYGVVSIHPADPAEKLVRIGPGPQGGIHAENVTVVQFLTFAYQVRDYQITGAPGWLSSDRFDMSFTADKTEVTPGPEAPLGDVQAFLGRNRQRMQAVLRDRFGLILRVETRELPIYALVAAKNGQKLTASVVRSSSTSLRTGRGQITAVGITMEMLANNLSFTLGRPVVDETGLDGQYDFKLNWTPDSSLQPPSAEPAASTTGPSIFRALTEQLGLRLESKKGPVQVCVIEKIEKPSEN